MKIIFADPDGVFDLANTVMKSAIVCITTSGI